MQVYRWEHKVKGHGPLCGLSVFDWRLCFLEHAAPNEFLVFREFVKKIPYTYKDIVFNTYKFYDAYFFAWDNLDKLIENLVDGAEDVLESHDYELMTYELHTDYLELPDGQVFFNKLKAKRTN